MIGHCRILVVALTLAALGAMGMTARVGNTQAAAEGPRTVYISTGDNQWALWLPMDSPATIEAAVDSLHARFNVDRILWRGGQDDLWFRSFQFREHNRFYWLLWKWVSHLVSDVGTNRAAIEAARERGMQIWAVTGLFEGGSAADAGGCTDFPYQAEDKLRLAHPEWIPANRYGTRLQDGPIEFAYPHARAATVDRLTRLVVDDSYDGIVFYTYVENFTLRYLDEFGYNQPIVDEFRRRYGVDIRTREFDKRAWARLRGRHVTQFLRELKASFARHGKKIAVFLDPEDMGLPQPWRPANAPLIRTAGRIHMDWKRWAKEGTVDELIVYWHPSETVRYKAQARLSKALEGTGCRVSMFMTVGDIDPAVTRVLFPGEEVASGFGYDNHIGWPDEQTEPQPLEALQSGDAYARRRVLYMISAGKQTADVDTLIPATRDEDVYVRRLALQALGTLKDPEAVPAIEAALLDPENSVRCQAAVVLGDLSGPESADRIFEAIREKGTFQFGFVAAAEALAKMGAANLQPILAYLDDPDVSVRRVALRTLYSMTATDMSPARDGLLRILRSDPDPYARELALPTLQRLARDPQVLAAMMDALNDGDEVVQVRAARYLSERVASASDAPEASRREVFDALQAMFRLYGDGCTRADADWGWRVIGNALLLFGPEGEQVLEDLMGQKQDRRLAQLAWQVLCLRQQAMNYTLVTEEEDAAAQAQRP